MQPAAVSIPTQVVMPQTEPQFKDKKAKSINGFIGLLIHLSLSVFNILLLATGPGALLLIITGPLWLILWNSYVIVNPNEAVVTQFFGRYVSTLKTEGFRFFFNPLYSKSKISFKINNFESSKLKVNDVNANPIDIAAAVSYTHLTLPTTLCV